MKTKSLALFATLFSFAFFLSCEKENVTGETNDAASKTIQTRSQGNNLFGTLVDQGMNEIPNVQIKIFDVNLSVPVDAETTDGNGCFEMTIPSASNYYFEIYQNSHVYQTTTYAAAPGDTLHVQRPNNWIRPN